MIITTRSLREWRRIQRRSNRHRRRLKLPDVERRLSSYIEQNKDLDDKTLIHNVRGKIVSLSHDLYRTHGTKGHRGRQKIRRILWDYTKREFVKSGSHINLDEYRPPHEQKGIIRWIINKFFKK